MRIALELVPHSKEYLQTELQAVKSCLPLVNAINIPDILTCNVRAWQSIEYVIPFYSAVIPHIRAIDINPQEPIPFKDFFNHHSIDEILIIKGDIPQNCSHRPFPTNSIEIIKKFKKEIPNLKIYAGIDPYRGNFREEIDYIKRKIDAGAEGFFTQPFFDLRLMEVYNEWLPEQKIYWGVSPVTSKMSQNYWITKNNVLFPKDFEPTLAWSRQFAKKCLKFVEQTGTNVYFMPIITNAIKYLEGIL